MIQRKQSIWLLIATLLNACVFYFCLYAYHVNENGVDGVKYLRINDHYPSLLIALVMTALPFITIFMFKNRKRQIRMSFAAIISVLAFIGLSLSRVTNLGKLVPPPTEGSYRASAILPVVAIIFLIMAITGIRKDDQLVKSVDRLR